MATDYASDKIRNVVLLGHSHDGKTMLAEAMLFASGAVARMGSPDQATATTDFEPEEHKRKISITIGVEQEFRGIVDLLHLKAFVTAEDGKGSEVPIPDDMKQRVEEYRGQLIEAAAESDDSLLEKYLDAGTLSEEEIQRGLRQGILDGKVAPVVCCSATKLLGVRTLMSTIAELMPPPEVEPDKPVKAFVFSTGGDQFGRISYFKVVAGTLKADAHLPNLSRGGEERLAQIFFPRGKEHVAASEVHAGDIAAATKLAHTLTGDASGLRDGGSVAPVASPGPAYSLAITSCLVSSLRSTCSVGSS